MFFFSLSYLFLYIIIADQASLSLSYVHLNQPKETSNLVLHVKCQRPG